MCYRLEVETHQGKGGYILRKIPGCPRNERREEVLEGSLFRISEEEKREVYWKEKPLI